MRFERFVLSDGQWQAIASLLPVQGERLRCDSSR